MLAGVLSHVSNSKRRAHWRGRDRGVSVTIPAKMITSEMGELIQQKPSRKK